MDPGSISTHNSFSTYKLPFEVHKEHFSIVVDTEICTVIFCQHCPSQDILSPVVLLIKMYECGHFQSPHSVNPYSENW